MSGHLGPGGEAVRGEQSVERHRQLRALLGRIEGVELVHPELAEGRVLHLADEARKVDARPGGPGMVDEVGEQDVLLARQRVGVDPHHGEQPRHVPLDLVGDGFGVGALGRRVEPADDVERYARARPGCVDRELGGIT
jgi:hypothetical protein